MAVKTITIDMEAYEALASRKREGESFSRVIKRTLASERYTAANLLEHLDKITFSPTTLDAMEESVASRATEMVAEPDQPYDA
ncbi:MAG: antitoxin VapB family protein [Spirochaetota bacterium]